MRRLWISAVLAGLAILLLQTPARAAVEAEYIFYAITSNSYEDEITAAEGQLRMTLIADSEDDTGVTFKFDFGSDSTVPMTVTGVYFDDGALLSLWNLDWSEGVVFVGGSGSPPDLPGGSGYGFQTTIGFLATATSPPAQNGVDPGEWLEVYFSLLDGFTYSTVKQQLDGGTDLRVGIHVQSIGTSGNSDSFIAFSEGDPRPSPIPEPATLAIWGAGTGLGLGALALRRRRERKHDRAGWTDGSRQDILAVIERGRNA